jgi:hypothetical protein
MVRIPFPPAESLRTFGSDVVLTRAGSSRRFPSNVPSPSHGGPAVRIRLAPGLGRAVDPRLAPYGHERSGWKGQPPLARPIAVLKPAGLVEIRRDDRRLLLVIGLALEGHASGQTEPLQPVFDETACDLPGVSPKIRPRLRCGTVSVPRNYDNPGEGRFKLAVVVVRSAQQPALPDPVVYLSGGPGSPLTIYADQQARMPCAPGRDFILVDQLASDLVETLVIVSSRDRQVGHDGRIHPAVRRGIWEAFPGGESESAERLLRFWGQIQGLTREPAGSSLERNRMARTARTSGEAGPERPRRSRRVV